MRQIFTSPRLENVEGVAKMLESDGIATKITGGRSWKGVSRRSFSYNDKSRAETADPAVWVLKPDDFKRARELLHYGNLLDATRDTSFLPEDLQFREISANSSKRMLRIKLVLLALIAGAAALALSRIFLR